MNTLNFLIAVISLLISVIAGYAQLKDAASRAGELGGSWLRKVRETQRQNEELFLTSPSALLAHTMLTLGAIAMALSMGFAVWLISLGRLPANLSWARPALWWLLIFYCGLRLGQLGALFDGVVFRARRRSKQASLIAKEQET